MHLTFAVSLFLSACLIGCGSSGATTSTVAFVAELQRAQSVDYTPLESADHAVSRADLIIRGRIEDVRDGLRIASPRGGGRIFAEMATLEVRIEEVISGSVARGAPLRVQVRIAGSSVTGLRRLLPDTDVILILDDITKWRPFGEEATSIEYPAGVDADDTLFMPYTDGIWFDGDGALRGGLDQVTLADGWGSPRTINELEDTLRAAAADR